MRIVNNVKLREFHDCRTAAYASKGLQPCIVPYGPQRFRGYAEARDYIMQNVPLFWMHLIKKYDNIDDITRSVYLMIRYNCNTNKPGWSKQ